MIIVHTLARIILPTLLLGPCVVRGESPQPTVVIGPPATAAYVPSGLRGDGVSDDTSTLQAALSGSYGYVLLPAGRTFLTDQINVQPNTTLDCSGSTLKAKSGGKVNYIIRLGTGGVSATNIRIINCVFDEANVVNTSGDGIGGSGIGAAVSPTSYNLQIDHNRFINIPTSAQTYHGIIMSGPIYAVLDSNYFPASGGDEMVITGLGFYTVSNNQFFSSGDGGLAINGNASVNVTGNLFFKCSLGIGAGPEDTYPTGTPVYGSSTAGTFVVSTEMITINNNTFVSNQQGITMGYYGNAHLAGPHNFTVTGNTFRDNLNGGFSYFGNPNPGATGFDTARGIVSGNVFYRVGSAGYNGTANAGPSATSDISVNHLQNLLISSNQFSAPVATGSGGNSAISVARVYNVDIRGNTIKSEEGGVYNFGLILNDGNNAQISGNHFVKVQTGILLTGDLGRPRRQQISNNMVEDFAINAIEAHGTVADLSVVGNHLATKITGANGINMTGSSLTYTLISGNAIHLANGTDASIYLEPTAGSQVEIINNATFGNPMVIGTGITTFVNNGNQ